MTIMALTPFWRPGSGQGEGEGEGLTVVVAPVDVGLEAAGLDDGALVPVHRLSTHDVLACKHTEHSKIQMNI